MMRPVSPGPSFLEVNSANLPAIFSRGVPVPTYNRSLLVPRILHIGVGGFHRSHLALYTHEAASRGETWGIRGLGLLAQDTQIASNLGEQDYLYSLTEKGPDHFDTIVIGSIIDFRLAASDESAAHSAIADPNVKILSLTITAAGYVEPQSGQRTTFDVIASGLEARRRNHSGPVTVLSCDNLPGNGDAAKAALISAGKRHSNELAEWIDISCSFPNSMVDRITPQTTQQDRQRLADSFQINDLCPVVGEPFRQWVIEDKFVAGRPRWEDVGVLFTDNVHAWELYKLRMLNASHSCMAYLSALAGITYVDEAMNVSAIVAYLEELLHNEAIPTLVEIPGHSRKEYARVTLERFRNTGVRDQIARLCIDGTAKFPTFLIPTVQRQLELDGPIRCSALALAAWAVYLGTVPVDQQSFDTSGDATRALAAKATKDPLAFLDLETVFPEALRNCDRFRQQFVNAYRTIAESGPLAAIVG